MAKIILINGGPHPEGCGSIAGLEGLQGLRNLARNISFMVKAFEDAREKYGQPEMELDAFASFPDGTWGQGDRGSDGTERSGVMRKGGELYGDLVGEVKDRAEEGIDYCQYCTVIPIATLLDSSWDTTLIEAMGSIAGEEMQRFHVDLWLSGRCAAAETRGVQQHPGCGLTLKHFACNNQEDSRCRTGLSYVGTAIYAYAQNGFYIFCWRRKKQLP